MHNASVNKIHWWCTQSRAVKKKHIKERGLKSYILRFSIHEAMNEIRSHFILMPSVYSCCFFFIRDTYIYIFSNRICIHIYMHIRFVYMCKRQQLYSVHRFTCFFLLFCSFHHSYCWYGNVWTIGFIHSSFSKGRNYTHSCAYTDRKLEKYIFYLCEVIDNTRNSCKYSTYTKRICVTHISDKFV